MDYTGFTRNNSLNNHLCIARTIKGSNHKLKYKKKYRIVGVKQFFFFFFKEIYFLPLRVAFQERVVVPLKTLS